MGAHHILHVSRIRVKPTDTGVEKLSKTRRVSAEYRCQPAPPSNELATNTRCPKAPYVFIPLFTFTATSSNAVAPPQFKTQPLHRGNLVAKSGFQSPGATHDIWSDRAVKKRKLYRSASVYPRQICDWITYLLAFSTPQRIPLGTSLTRQWPTANISLLRQWSPLWT